MSIVTPKSILKKRASAFPVHDAETNPSSTLQHDGPHDYPAIFEAAIPANPYILSTPVWEQQTPVPSPGRSPLERKGRSVTFKEDEAHISTVIKKVLGKVPRDAVLENFLSEKAQAFEKTCTGQNVEYVTNPMHVISAALFHIYTMKAEAYVQVRKTLEPELSKVKKGIADLRVQTKAQNTQQTSLVAQEESANAESIKIQAEIDQLKNTLAHLTSRSREASSCAHLLGWSITKQSENSLTLSFLHDMELIVTVKSSSITDVKASCTSRSRTLCALFDYISSQDYSQFTLKNPKLFIHKYASALETLRFVANNIVQLTSFCEPDVLYFPHEISVSANQVTVVLDMTVPALLRRTHLVKSMYPGTQLEKYQQLAKQGSFFLVSACGYALAAASSSLAPSAVPTEQPPLPPSRSDMPAGNTIWVTSLPGSGSLETQADEVKQTVSGRNFLADVIPVKVPEFKAGTLNDLLKLSEYLQKQDSLVVGNVNKIAESIASLSERLEPNSDLESKLVLDNGQSYHDYLFDPSQPWKWNSRKYRTDFLTLTEVASNLLHESSDIENSQRAKTQSYQNLKNQLQAAQRKQTGNLSSKALDDVVSEEDFADTKGSEYLSKVLLAVPKNLTNDFLQSYERYSNFVVPRSAHSIASDSEFTLFSVIVFEKFKDSFVQKSRENKLIVRDFVYNADEIAKNREELEALEHDEKEVVNELYQLSLVNFSDAFQVLVHFKVIRAYVESILHYGLFTEFLFLFIKPDPKSVDQLVSTLADNFTDSRPNPSLTSSGSSDDILTGEYATVMEQEFLPFVVQQVENVKI